MTIKKIFVIGAGAMGNGIAQTAAVSGYETTMMDVAQEALEKGVQSIEKSVNKLEEKEKIKTEQKEAALNISITTNMEGISDTDLVIEAATENPDLKFNPDPVAIALPKITSDNIEERGLRLTCHMLLEYYQTLPDEPLQEIIKNI